MKNCSGKCIAGIIVAIIFGGLFLWTLVLAYRTHITDLWNYNVLPWYILSLVFLVIAKGGKKWGMGCLHCMPESGKK